MPNSSSPSRCPYTLEDFDFTLPPELIAQQPAAERSGSRLLDGRGNTPVDRVFRELPALLQPGDLLVFNDTRVIRARLFGCKWTPGGSPGADVAPRRGPGGAGPALGPGSRTGPGVELIVPLGEAATSGLRPGTAGGRVELLVERLLPGTNEVWAHLRASKSPRPGSLLRLEGRQGGPAFEAEVLGRCGPDGGLFHLRFAADPLALLEAHGHVPLPPYIAAGEDADNERRYQTVFARAPGAVAAPTAALHFDHELLATLADRGVGSASVTLHVGAGTFQPVRVNDLTAHRMHSECFELPQATVDAIARTRAAGGRVVAVGTTTLRALESAARPEYGGAAAGASALPGDGSAPTAGARETDIFITPGFDFRVVDLLVTNFHLPKSTLLMLVSAFAGHARMHALYAHAIRERYRFFSYGDAMLLERSPPV